MANHEKIANQEREAKLLPVVGGIVVCYVFIVIASYFIGNFIYQIP